MELNGCNLENRNRGSHDDSEEDNCVPFDIENSRRRNSDVDSDVNGIAIDSLSSRKSPPTPVSAADILKTLFFILVWYTFSTFLTLYNKTLLGDDMGRFPAPLLMNTVHFTMQAVLSTAITWYWSDRFRPNVAMSWKDYFIRVVPTALGTAFDVNLSNVSLVFISVTFATMCKSAAPIFLILFAFAFRLESPSAKLFGIIMVISVGILLTVAKETEFEFWGFVFVMLAAVMSGFRWCMTQILLQKEAYGLKNPLTLMSYVTPVMAISTGLLSLVLDPWHEFNKTSYFNNSWHVARSCLLMFFGGTLAFFMVLTEFVLISVTSAVTVTIAGVVKEAVTILVAVIYFHDKFTWLKGAGLLIIMVGVGFFNWYKYQKLQKGQTSENDSAGSSPTNVATKYVILDEMDDLDDGT
ncbi:probable sugar phosphate/phosphate translocator At1g06470 [Populus alba]|uniref:probable sugar phosphate/phosphate translocator At1g06470 n=1 Tax=Populus alba TaxID=43335 RepID=UPI0015894A30|nr:probable sugar phosphate/phosphate translocator At1g06470 isoform X2 [Populus alba]XP_034923584.1 probable sugar phosphate/phosphate translocator At1g06470 isoform X2 [Populus alba]XP_034923585.1 probable sugar phosphate/phosphate translocator At1g06470 isoform X2 [Populus alba]